jgi:hypothetical protein
LWNQNGFAGNEKFEKKENYLPLVRNEPTKEGIKQITPTNNYIPTPTASELTICCWNARSLRTNQKIEFLNTFNCDIIVIQEIWQVETDML